MSLAAGPGRPSRAGRWAETGLDLAAGGLMFLLMALTCVDVAGRYFLKIPVRGGLELTEILMTLIVFAGLPLVTARHEHVTVDFLDAFLPEPLKRVLGWAIDALGMTCLTVAAWQLWVRAARAAAAGDTTAQLKIAIAPVIYLMSVLMFAAAVGLAIRLLAPARRAAA
ncbi:MAG: TRAP transporter small permease [Burkholderiales bacterium]|nr:TRAP transporter small permease [Burkholderiales bacterium]